MSVQSHIFSHPNTGLLCSAKQYIPTGDAFDLNGLTLVFAHCTSAHKEQWEPTIHKLFELASTSAHARIREAWALDWQSHGDAAMLNEKALLSRDGVSVEEYADLLQYFVQSSYVSGHRLVAIGHSASTSAWTLATKSLVKLPFVSMIFIEPVMIISPILSNDERIEKGKLNVKAVLARRDKWDNADHAAEWLSKRYPWKSWDSRILKIYREYGLTTVKNGGSTYVTTKCTKAQEVGCYTPEAHILAGTELARICPQIPVHSIFGQRPEMVSLGSREAICNATAGRPMASVKVIPDAGHLVPQEKPDEVASCLFDIIKSLGLPFKASL